MKLEDLGGKLRVNFYSKISNSYPLSGLVLSAGLDLLNTKAITLR